MNIKQRRTDKEVIQERAIKTRDKLITSALELYMRKGYYSTTVDEIAKNADLSTGVAYRYFKNKKELLLSALTFAFDNIKNIAGVSETDFSCEDIESVLTVFEMLHTDYRDFHEELEGLRHSDADVKKLYEDFYRRALMEVYDSLPQDTKNKPHSWEKLKLSIGLMENYCHMYMDKADKDDEIIFMRDEVIRLVKRLMWEE